MITAALNRRALTACFAVALLAGCGGGLSPSGSAGLSGAGNAMPQASAVHPAAATKQSTLTVHYLGTTQPVADANVALGWGSACFKYHCTSYQRKGKTGGKGRITFTGLPTSKTNWCTLAVKSGNIGVNCTEDKILPIPSAIQIYIPK